MLSQQQKDETCLSNNQTSPRSKESSNNKTRGRCKFVGVRQRPSGKWVAEIKNTTQKIRIWLGTFDTAEEAARAYDEAAFLLRGSNTRTNFVADYRALDTNNSPLSLKIRNLINQKKNGLVHSQSVPAPAPPIIAAPAPIAHAVKADYDATSAWNHHIDIDSNSNNNNYSWLMDRSAADVWMDNDTISYKQLVFDGGYRPDMSNCNSSQFQSSADQISAAGGNSWPLTVGEEPQQQLFFPSTLADGDFELLPGAGGASFSSSDRGNNQSDVSEFERMKLERQISATLYAANGVNDLENVSAASHNSSINVPNWDLSMFYESFCLT